MQTENKLNITAGEWKCSDHNNFEYIDIDSDLECCRISSVYTGPEDYRSKEEREANALLIADAGTTANKCGLLPSELLRQRDELREIAEKILEDINAGRIDAKNGIVIDSYVWNKLNTALASTRP